MRIGKGINWILILLSCLIAIVLISFMFFFNHKKQDVEAVNTPTSEQLSTTSTTATSTTTTSSTTTQDSVTTTEEKLSTQEEQTNAKSQKNR